MDSIHSEYDMEDKKAADGQDDDVPQHNSSKIQRLLAKKPHKNKIRVCVFGARFLSFRPIAQMKNATLCTLPFAFCTLH